MEHLMMESLTKKALLWFGAGFVLAAILSVSYETARFVPVSIAFGLLCFICGILLMQFLALREKTKELQDSWFKQLSELHNDRLKFDAEKTAWEGEKEAWETDKESAIRKEAVRLLEEEAARRGGEQIDRDIDSDEAE
jgi:hypothetical protein